MKVLAVISVGGGLGALARYGLSVAMPRDPAEFPWATFATNVSGCLLIGALMALTADLWPDQRLLRPFLGTGLLGGFTTFSTYVVDIQQLLRAGETVTAFAYLISTVTSALLAVYVGMLVAKLVAIR